VLRGPFLMFYSQLISDCRVVAQPCLISSKSGCPLCVAHSSRKSCNCLVCSTPSPSWLLQLSSNTSRSPFLASLHLAWVYHITNRILVQLQSDNTNQIELLFPTQSCNTPDERLVEFKWFLEWFVPHYDNNCTIKVAIRSS